MKRSLNSFRRYSVRTILFISLSILFAGILFYSCRKVEKVLYSSLTAKPFNPAAVITKNDLLNWYNELPAPSQNEVSNEDGLKNGRGKLPFPLQWDKARQRIIDGKHVIRVPINNTSAMAFVKDGPNGVIKAHVFKWLDLTKKGEKFTGRIFSLNMQDFKFLGTAIKKGKVVYNVNYPRKDGFTEAQLKQLKESFTTQKTTSTTSRPLKALSFWDGLLNVIGNTLGAIGCAVTGRVWDTGPNGSWDDNSYWDINEDLGQTWDLSCNDSLFGKLFASNSDSSSDPNQRQVSDNNGNSLGLIITSGNLVDGGSGSGGYSNFGDSSGGDSSGGGSGGGLTYNPTNLSDLFWSTFTMIWGGNVRNVKDPCIEKSDVIFRASQTVISQHNADALAATMNTTTNPNHKEDGYDVRLTSLVGQNVYKDTPVRTNPTGPANSFFPFFKWTDADGFSLGASHGHYSGDAPSPADVTWMAAYLTDPDLLISSQSLEVYKRYVSVTILTSTSTYVVTVRNWDKMRAYRAAYEANPSAVNAAYTSAGNAHGSSEYALLSMYDDAINVYKAPAGTTNFVPIHMGNYDEVENVPCN